MNMVIDVGNTLTKVGIFENDQLSGKEVFADAVSLHKFLAGTAVDNLIVSSVSRDPAEIVSSSVVHGLRILLNSSTSLPLSICYSTPATLGLDRIAGACGAWFLFPGEDSLVIDIGTCINYEFVKGTGEYMGGAIAPGLAMRFESMHQFTSRLPKGLPIDVPPLTGDSTMTCLQSGVMNGALEEIKGIIQRYKADRPGIRVILCGGDSHFFEKHLKPPIFVAPELVLKGLNSILSHNVAH